jgi:hypothetical protein
MLGTPCPNKSILLDQDPRYERYGTGIFTFAGTRTGTGILLPVPSSPDDIELTRLGVEAEKNGTEPNAVHYHKQLLLPNAPMLPVQQLHDVCNIDQCSLWYEALENAFQKLDTVVERQAIVDLGSDEEFEDQGTGGEMSLEEMERLLSRL